MTPAEVVDATRRIQAAASIDDLHRELSDHEFMSSLITAEIRARQAKQRDEGEG